MSDHFYPEPELDQPDRRADLVLRILRQTQDSLTHAIQLLEQGGSGVADDVLENLTLEKQRLDTEVAESSTQRVLEGVFDGQQMVASDGAVYQVPSNYASKSKLVEGDLLKLTIRRDGGFLFKQTGPIERKRIVGTLALEKESGEYVVVGQQSDRWRVLRASVTYFKGEPGDEAVIMVPKTTPSSWAAVENILKG
ncbi:MAG: hypothetical protein AAB337_01915 [Patescibacteria group bacterium]